MMLKARFRYRNLQGLCREIRGMKYGRTSGRGGGYRKLERRGRRGGGWVCSVLFYGMSKRDFPERRNRDWETYLWMMYPARRPPIAFPITEGMRCAPAVVKVA